MMDGGKLYQPQDIQLTKVPHLTLHRPQALLLSSAEATSPVQGLACVIWLQSSGPARIVCRASMLHRQTAGEDKAGLQEPSGSQSSRAAAKASRSSSPAEVSLPVCNLSMFIARCIHEAEWCTEQFNGSCGLHACLAGSVLHQATCCMSRMELRRCPAADRQVSMRGCCRH